MCHYEGRMTEVISQIETVQLIFSRLRHTKYRIRNDLIHSGSNFGNF
jgi:hypothetical protein